MGLRETVQKAAQTAFAAVGNLAVSANYLAHASTAYNASPGTTGVAYSTVAGVAVVFAGFEFSKIDGEKIKPQDKKALIPALALPSVSPKPDDVIVASGVTWTVVRRLNDPADALYTLQVRLP